MGALAIAAGGFLASPRVARDSVLAADAQPTAGITITPRPAAPIPPRATAEDTVATRDLPPSALAGWAMPAAIQDFAAIAEVPAGETVRAARAVPPAPPAAPRLAPGDRVQVTVSFYYCEVGSRVAAVGDGGGFCGAMRDGSVVYNGAAACDYAYLGQRFRIEGDPLKRIYRCADTGSAVHGLHRDIWFGSSDDGWAWQRSVGQLATIEVLP